MTISAASFNPHLPSLARIDVRSWCPAIGYEPEPVTGLCVLGGVATVLGTEVRAA
jgi:hypothetical protein